MAKQKQLKAKDKIYPVVFIVLALLLGLAVYSQASQNGWTLWNFGGNGNGKGTGTNQTVIPINQLGFKMSLVAVRPDGSNFTVNTGHTLPGLASFSQVPVQVNSQTIKYIEADGIAGFQSSTPFSDSALAEFKLNVTAVNMQTAFLKWTYEDVTTKFVNGGVLALTLLPTMQMTAAQVFNNLQCNILTNGTTLCTPVSSAPSLVQIEFVVTGNVTVTDPSTPGFSFVPLNGRYSSAMSLGLGASACVNCGGGTNTISGSGTISGGGAKNIVVPTKTGPTGGNPSGGILASGTSSVSITSSGVTTLHPATTVPGTTAMTSTATYSIKVTNPDGTTTTTTENVQRAGISGREDSSGKIAIENGDKVAGGRIQLIPQGSTIPLNIGNWTVLLNWPLMGELAALIVVILVGVYLIVRISLKRHK